MDLEGLWILSLLPFEESATNLMREIHMELKFTEKWLSGTADTQYHKEDYLFHVHGEINKDEKSTQICLYGRKGDQFNLILSFNLKYKFTGEFRYETDKGHQGDGTALLVKKSQAWRFLEDPENTIAVSWKTEIFDLGWKNIPKNEQEDLDVKILLKNGKTMKVSLKTVVEF